MCQRLTVFGVLTVTILAVGLSPRWANADLAHRYSFTSDASDSVGGADGTVVDIGAVTNAVFTGGMLDVSANTGQGSNAISEDAYVDLPNGLITTAASAGVSGAFSFEAWVTISETRTWQRIVDVGSSNGGEDASDGGGAVPYIYIAGNHGRFGGGVGTEAHAANQAGPATEVGLPGAPPVGVELHVVGTYDQNDTSAGPNGTGTLYRDGALVGSFGLPTGLDLNTFTNNNNWLGRSQWPDPVFDGSYNEFRIYDHALTGTEVGTSFVFGPDIVSTGELLSLTVNVNTGQITMTNESTMPIDVDFYRITSPGSALSTAGWNSLDEQNYDAVDGPDGGTTAGDSDGEGWDEAGGSDSSQLVELFLREEGSSIAAGEMLGLGNAFNTSIFGPGNDGDLEFMFSLVGGIELTGNISYVGGGADVDGDFNNDGVVNAADYVLWRNGGPLQNDPTPGVQAADYDFWVSRFGATSGSGAGNSSVPEPAAWMVAVLGAALLSCRGRLRSNGC
jgi:hypothetical protein